MLCIEIIAVRSEIRTKHINILCGKKVVFLNVELDDTYINCGLTVKGAAPIALFKDPVRTAL
jgi:hypothetical protein